MLLFTFLSRAADSVNIAQVETKTAQNQVITHEVTGTGKVMGTRERAVFTQEGQKVEQVYVQEGQECEKRGCAAEVFCKIRTNIPQNLLTFFQYLPALPASLKGSR